MHWKHDQSLIIMTLDIKEKYFSKISLIHCFVELFMGYNLVFLTSLIVRSIMEKNANYNRFLKDKRFWRVYVHSILSSLEDVSTRQTFSEIAGNIDLQNVLLRSSSVWLHFTIICAALRKIRSFLHHFSIFNTLFPCFDYQKVIIIQNKYDILNQHQKLHWIVYILTKYFSCRYSTWGGPQDKNQEKMAEEG